jgi:hypothetical protein
MKYNENERITISGLNSEQVVLLDMIWSCENEIQFFEWYMSLSYRNQQTVESLLEILRQELIEKYLDMKNTKEVDDLMARLKSK